MGYIEWIHKPDKKAKDYDPSKRRLANRLAPLDCMCI